MGDQNTDFSPVEIAIVDKYLKQVKQSISILL